VISSLELLSALIRENVRAALLDWWDRHLPVYHAAMNILAAADRR
jgi:hypothetical protein